jgi:hypothetical protein
MLLSRHTKRGEFITLLGGAAGRVALSGGRNSFDGPLFFVECYQLLRTRFAFHLPKTYA